MTKSSYLIFIVIFIPLFFLIEVFIFNQELSTSTLLMSILAGLLTILILYVVRKVKSQKV